MIFTKRFPFRYEVSKLYKRRKFFRELLLTPAEKGNTYWKCVGVISRVEIRHIIKRRGAADMTPRGSGVPHTSGCFQEIFTSHPG
jgi:hypothetical protein